MERMGVGESKIERGWIIKSYGIPEKRKAVGSRAQLEEWEGRDFPALPSSEDRRRDVYGSRAVVTASFC